MDKRRAVRTVLYVLASLGLGLLLISRLEVIGSFEFGQVLERAERLRPLFVILIVGSTLFNFWITAFKWRTVVRATEPEKEFRISFFFYTSVTVLVSQFLPPQVSAMATRSVSLRLHDNYSVSKGALSTVYDQLYDLLVPLSLLAPAVLVMGGWISALWGLFLSVVFLGIVGAIAVSCGRELGSLLAGVGLRVPLLRRIVRRFIPGKEAVERSTLFGRGFVAKMFCLSVIRYGNLVLRACLVIFAAGFDIGIPATAYGFVVVAYSFLIGITPAGIGIAEWGWVGVLHLFGISAGIAASFALSFRLLTVASVLVINAVVLVVYLGKTVRSRMVRGGDVGA